MHLFLALEQRLAGAIDTSLVVHRLGELLAEHTGALALGVIENRGDAAILIGQRSRLDAGTRIALLQHALSSSLTGTTTEHDRLHQRVTTKAVRAMDRDARNLARGPEARNHRLAPDIAIDATHLIVGTRADRDRLLDRIDAGVIHRQLAATRQTRLQLLPTQVGQVEHHTTVDATTISNLAPLSTRHDVAGGQLHRVRRVVDHEALAILIAQIATLTTTTLGDQHAVRLKRRRMELHELHVLQRHTSVPGKRHAVARARKRVRRAVVHTTNATRRENHMVGLNRMQATLLGIPSDDTSATTLVDNNLGREELLVDLDVVLDQLLVEHVDQDVARDVGRIDRARRTSSTERTLSQLAIGSARKDRAHVLELVNVVRRLTAHDLNRVLVAEIIRTLDGVVGVALRRILGRIAERGIDATLRSTRM